ncbi:MAG: 50S ribosomal protein L18 [Anaerolineales bacterium]|jgi:large subunit ribosomal protein L18
MATKSRRDARKRRHVHVRRHLSGTEVRPRLSVFRSLVHIYAQVIDDLSGKTLVAASSLDRELGTALEKMNKTDQAREVGKLIATRAHARGISKVVFDRGGYRYHGRVRALAEAARSSGLEF